MSKAKKPVILILVDGMRPDGLTSCGNPFVDTMREKWAYSLHARTVMPSVTLPCHMSLFHSVDPERHGIVTNTYVPQVRPVKGLIDALDDQGFACASFYNWEELRDLSRPGHLRWSQFITMHGIDESDRKVTDAMLRFLPENPCDFTFLYLGETDEAGHDHGWMGPEYETCIRKAVDCIRDVYEQLSDTYTILVTADHGGHERSHGTEAPEDMTIPVFACGPDFRPGETLGDVSIKDLAPTIAKIVGAEASMLPREWEGRSLV